MIAAFEAVLKDSFGLDPATCREGDDWWRFTVDGVRFQGGVHRADVRALATICGVASDVDVDALYADIAANPPPEGLAGFREADCYLYAEARVPFAQVTREQIHAAIRDCITATRSDAAAALRSRWRD